MARLRRQVAIEFLERLPRPESLLESIHGSAHARIKKGLIDRDRPNPDRAQNKPDHHSLDDPVRLPEQAEQGEFGRTQAWHGQVGRIHGLSSLSPERWAPSRGPQGTGERSIERSPEIPI